MDTKFTIKVGATRKLNRSAYGGLAFESSDCWVALEKEFPGNLDHETIETHTRYLQRTADILLQEQVNKTIRAIKPEPKKIDPTQPF